VTISGNTINRLIIAIYAGFVGTEISAILWMNFRLERIIFCDFI
jgi:hypothetical protein